MVEEVRELWESQKRLKIRELELEALKARGRELVEKVEEEKSSREHQGRGGNSGGDVQERVE